MKIGDIEVGQYVLCRYHVKALRHQRQFKGYGGFIERPVTRMPAVKGWQKVRVIEKMPRGRLIVAEEKWTWKPPPPGTIFHHWFLTSKNKKAIMVEIKFEIASRSVREYGV